MTRSDLAAVATRFHEMHRTGRLLLPNAWDAASARIFEDAGFPAVATTSAGIAWARGLPDGEHIARDAMIGEIASIAAAVGCPVTADVEAGYGAAPVDVATTVEAVVDAGAVGINLEDSGAGRDGNPLFAVAHQAGRVAAAREAAERRGVPILINARTDTFLLALGGDLQERMAMTVERGRAYLAAGADVVFVPGLLDSGIVQELAGAIAGPISLLTGPGAPPADVLFSAGACRVSLGSSAMLATLGGLRALAHELRERGAFTQGEGVALSYRDGQALFANRTRRAR